ncbi:UNVERIFIED_CONTAM: LysR family transcriptional regulator, partial [Mumia flava]
MLEIRHLRTLIALADGGSVSRAAERLHLTQSALSHQLRALESYYGLAVVRRKGQTVELTEAGERMLELAQKVVADIQAAERDLERIKGRAAGTLRIALECHH